MATAIKTKTRKKKAKKKAKKVVGKKRPAKRVTKSDNKKAEEEQLKRLQAHPTLPSVIPGQRHQGQVTPSKVLKKCKYPLCTRLVDEQGCGQYCTMVCSAFDKRRLRALLVAAGERQYSEYMPRFANEDLHAYLQECEVSHGARFMQVGSDLIPIRNVQVPSQSGFALYLGFSEVTIKRWATRHEEFRSALGIIKQVQRHFLISKGLTKAYDPQLTKFLLMNNHGMKDKREDEHNINLLPAIKAIYSQADAIEETVDSVSEQYDDDESTIS